MKNNLLFTFVPFFVIVANAQIQNQATSSERHVIINSSSDKYIKVKTYNESVSITLLKDDFGPFVFVKSNAEDNTVKISPLFGIDSVLDFSLYQKEIYFCGTSANRAFIAHCPIEELFNGGPIIYDTIKYLSKLHDLEVFTDLYSQPKMRITAIGYDTNGNDCFLDLYMGAYCYCLVFNNTLHCLTQTQNYVAAICTDSINNQFKIIKFDKHMMPNITQSFYQCPNGYFCGQPFYPKFVTTNHYLKNYVFVSSVIDGLNPNYPNAAQSIEVYGIRLDDFSLLFTQVLPTETKPHLKSMVFSPKYNTIHLLANSTLGQYYGNLPANSYVGGDLVYDIDISKQINYTCSITRPNNSTGGINLLNSIDYYQNDYYIIAGKNGNKNLYWFDKDNISSQGSCSQKFGSKVFIETCTFNPSVFPNPWFSTPSGTTTIHTNPTTSNYIIDCAN